MIASIYPVTHSTNHVGPGSCFVAIKGARHNGVDFIPDALERGATRIVVQNDNMIDEQLEKAISLSGAQLTYVDNARRALAELSAHALGYPARKLKIIGITGTKGKTTTAFLLEHMLRSAGYKTALLTTVHNKIIDTVVPAELTTAHPDYLHMFLNMCVEKEVEYVVMEVAAQALTLHRVHGIEFEAGIFTNFSQEHGEFYPSLRDYFEAKCSLLRHCKPSAPVVLNADDEWCLRCNVEGVRCVYFGTETKYDVAHAPECYALPGLFNAYNISAALALATECGVSLGDITRACATFPGVPGRMQKYMLPNGAVCYIDYAHNPSSFEAVFSTLRAQTDNLIVVFGCGGEKDPIKRPMMGEVADKYANYIVLTNDDPRREDPYKIIQDIKDGIRTSSAHKVVEYLDRQQAIIHAYERSRKGSIIALLGKGPCEYQEVNGVKYPFSERAIIQQLHARN